VIASIAADSTLTVPGMATGFPGAPRPSLDTAARAAQAAAAARLAASLLGTEIGFVAYLDGELIDLAGLVGGAELDRDALLRHLDCWRHHRAGEPPNADLLATTIRAPSGEVLGMVGGLGVGEGGDGFGAAGVKAGSAALLDDLALLLAAGEAARRSKSAAEAGMPLLRAAIDSLPHHFWVTDATGHYVEQNALDRGVFGELIGQRVDAVEPPVEIVARWRDAHRRVLQGETVRFTASRPDVYGHAEVEVLMTPLVIDGSIRGQVGLTIDRTDLVSLAKRLEASEARLHAALDALPYPFFICALDGRLELTNQADRALWGDCVGKRYDELGLPPEVVAHMTRAFAAVREGRTERALLRYELGGRMAEVEEVYAPVYAGERVAGIVGLIIDHTERALAERQLRESRARLADYLDTASDWVWETDAAHRLSVLEGNRPAGSMPVEQVLGRCRWELVGADPAADPLWGAHLADLEAHRPFRAFVYRAAAPDGHTVWTEVSGNPVFDAAGAFLGYRGSGREITDSVLARERLEASEARLEDYLATASDWLWETDAEHRITSLAGFPENPAVPADKLIGQRRWELVAADLLNDPSWREHVEDLQAHRPFRGFVYAYASADRATTWIELSGNPVFDAAGTFLGYRGTARNVTKRRTAELALREAHAKLDAMTQSGLVGVTGGHGFLIEEANDAFLALLGLERSALERGLDWRELVPPEHVVAEEAAAISLAYTGAVYTTETSYRRSDGVRVPVLINSVVLDGTKQRWFALIQDLTPMKLAEARMRELAEHDLLTGLVNRQVLFDRLQGDLAERREPGATGALLLLDLDRFKETNDTLGHAAGDRLLQAVGARLSAVLRDTDTIARVGGDEFALILRGLRGPATAADMAEKILEALAEPLVIEGRLIRPTGSLGISLLAGDGNDAAELMRMADIALYQAKARGGGTFCFFEPALLTVIERRRQIALALQAAIDSEAFTVALQPKICLASGARVGFEALVRWRLDGVPLEPGAFIGIAADNGSIVPLGRIVRRRAFEAWARLAGLGIAPGSLAVNVHVAELKQPGFRDELAGLLETWGMAADRLEVEVTEAVLLDRDDGVVFRSLEALRRLGVAIVLDDFGTGLASLTQLKRFPVDRLKIDRSVIRDIGVDPGDAVLVRGIIDLAHTLELSVVAEGVETAEQLAFLIEHGCDFAQGYHLAPPLEVDDLVATFGHPADVAAAAVRAPTRL
jgi:diguanylate cyclase (GGDEF)-like protein/PAS domain S-box-containing protein